MGNFLTIHSSLIFRSRRQQQTRLVGIDHGILRPFSFEHADDFFGGAPFTAFGRFQGHRS